ncbi:MAG: tetratricopeptide repeat protein [Pyrinomonadaceae bacterium]
MLRKNYHIFFLAIALFLASGVAAFAQTAPVRGKVELKKADGTTVPIADAVIDVYRMDVVNKPPGTKTNKKGEFSFAGLQLGATYMFAISAPNARPQVFPNIKAGNEAISITLSEGDGKRLTEDEARQQLSAVVPAGQTTELTAEQKKAQEEFQKKNEEITTKNKKIENNNTIVNNSLTEGGKAFNARNYDLAIAKYDEGINADPDFEGTAPVLLNNKSAALINRAIDKYNAAIRGDPAGKSAALELVKKDLEDAVSASNKSLQILKGATATDANVQKAYTTQKNLAYQNLLDGYTKMFAMGVDTTKGKEALTILDEYSTSETDAAKKARFQLALADGLRIGADSENAIVAYRKALETSPDNPDVLAGLGLSLFNSGVISDNKEQKQEGLNFMQRFADIAPETHPLKASVKDAVEYLKTQDKLTPQKTTKTTTKKKS